MVVKIGRSGRRQRVLLQHQAFFSPWRILPHLRPSMPRRCTRTCTTTRPTAVVGGRAVAKKLGTSHQLVGVAMAPAMVEAHGGKIP